MSDQAFETWVKSVATGAATMSQRTMNWVEANGGIDHLVAVAKRSGIHLVQLTDEKGKKLLAASQQPFKTLC